MSKKHQISLPKYLTKLSSAQKKELCLLLRKKLDRNKQPAYIYQCISGTNRPEIGGLVVEAIVKYSQKNKINHCYVTEESIAAGYEASRKSI